MNSSALCQRRPVLDRGRPLVELRQRVGVVRRQSLEPVIGVVRQEAVVRGQHHRLVAWPAGHLLNLGVDLAVVPLGAWRTAIGPLAVSVGVGVGDDDVGPQHVGDVLGERHGADRADRACGHDDPPPGVGAVPARDREGDLDESECPCRGEQNGQRGLQPEGQQRGAGQRGQHRQQRPGVDGDNTEREAGRARRTAGTDHQPQRADHAQRAQQRELEHRERQLRAVGRQVVQSPCPNRRAIHRPRPSNTAASRSARWPRRSPRSPRAATAVRHCAGPAQAPPP